MDRQVEKGTEISELHESVLYLVLTFLPFEDAVRTSVLSKKWNSIPKCFPVTEFKLPGFMKRMPVDTPEFQERNRHFLHFVDRSLQNKLSTEKIGFHVSDIDDDSLPLVNAWLPLSLRHGVSDLRFFFDNRNYYPLPETTFSVNSGSSEFLNLKKLKLSNVLLSESIVRDIIRNCPNLSDLSLLDIDDGLETLHISKLVELASLTIRVQEGESDIELRSIFVDAVSLEYISLRFSGDYTPGRMIDLMSCSNLRQLKLCNISISNNSFNQHISRFPLLEVLDVSLCDKLQKIKISLRRLKHLELANCIELEAVEIDAPMLSKFDFTPYECIDLPVLVLPNVIPGFMYLSYNRDSYDERFDNSWFREIREFLTAPFKAIFFSFCNGGEFSPTKLSFDHDDLREAVIPQLVEVECLDISELEVKHSFHWETLFDGLLWSCHPKMIRIKMTTDCADDKNWIKIKVLSKMLKERECRLCCNLPSCKCWRHRLKAVKMERVFRQFNSKSVIENDVPNPEDNEVRFVFDWDHSV